MSIRPLDKQKCPLNIQMSIRPVDQQKYPLDIQMSIRPMDEQKCPLDIQMSIRPLDEQKCPLDIQMSIRPLDSSLLSTWGQTDVKHDSFLSTGGYAWSHYVITAIGQTEMSIGHKYMSIRPLDEQKCPLDIQMSIRPLDEWTLSNGKHSSLLSTWGQT